MGMGELSLNRTRPIFDYLVVLFGSLCIALALNWFLVPNQVAAGGVSGLATVVYYLTGLPVGITMLLVNVPLFLISLKVLGPTFGVKTVVGAISTSLFVDLIAGWVSPLTTDPALASIYGGVLSGIGIGVTFRVGGSTGGTDIAARLLHHWFRFGPGRMLMVADGFVIAVAGVVFGAELALYAFIAVYLTGRVIDFIQEGGVYAKAAFIVSTESDAIARSVMHDMERGVTELKGQGMFTGTDRPVLFIIVPRGEIAQLRRLVAQIDPKAFMVLTDVSEVLGEGFREHDISPERRLLRKRGR